MLLVTIVLTPRRVYFVHVMLVFSISRVYLFSAILLSSVQGVCEVCVSCDGLVTYIICRSQHSPP